MNNENLKIHIKKYLDQGIRYDGRKTDEIREVSIEYNVSNSAEGSARVKIGNTEVIAGVKMALEKPYPDTPDEGMLMVGVELLPASNPKFESGPPNIRSIETARVVDRGIRESKSIENKKLCVTPGEKVWSVMVDICTINDEGNLLDCAGLAAIAAIKNARFPKVENGVIDYKTKTEEGLPIAKMPIPITVYKIAGYLVVDPTLDEENAYDARLTVTSTADGHICALQKGGDAALSSDDIKAMVELGIDKAQKMRKHIEG